SGRKRDGRRAAAAAGAGPRAPRHRLPRRLWTGPVKLSALLAGVEGARVAGDADLEVAEVRDDSRRVTTGALFVAVPGTAADGRQFLADAIARGAAAVAIE